MRIARLSPTATIVLPATSGAQTAVYPGAIVPRSESTRPFQLCPSRALSVEHFDPSAIPVVISSALPSGAVRLDSPRAPAKKTIGRLEPDFFARAHVQDRVKAGRSRSGLCCSLGSAPAPSVLWSCHSCPHLFFKRAVSKTSRRAVLDRGDLESLRTSVRFICSRKMRHRARRRVSRRACPQRSRFRHDEARLALIFVMGLILALHWRRKIRGRQAGGGSIHQHRCMKMKTSPS